MAVTKKALLAQMVAGGLTRREAERAYRAIVRALAGALERRERITLRGFGSFSTRVRPFHWRQIPRDAEIVRIPERTHVVFRPGVSLRDAADASPDDPYFDLLVARRRRNSQQLLSRPEINPLVHDAQFDMGIAYREMAQAERALAKFQAALSLLGDRERGARYVRCCYMIGLCHRDLGEFELAERWFTAGLDAPRRPIAERIELQYQLGLLYEAEGRPRDALTQLRHVFIVNPRFRDVAGHIKSLKALRLAQTVLR
jgi:integration host factor subunit beta